jgi:hypothetical protein
VVVALGEGVMVLVGWVVVGLEVEALVVGAVAVAGLEVVV